MMAEGPVTTAESVAVRLEEVVWMAVGPVTTVEPVAMRPVEVESVAVVLNHTGK